jgi:hypothetical protein
MRFPDFGLVSLMTPLISGVVLIVVSRHILVWANKQGLIRFPRENPVPGGMDEIFRHDLAYLSGDAIVASRIKAIVEIDKRVKTLQA